MNKSHARLLGGRRAAPILIALGVALAGAAQAQLIYPHSPSEERTTTAISEGLAKAKASHLGAIDRHRTFLTEALGRQRRLLAQRELAQRDAMVAEILANRDPRATPQAQLDREIDGRLASITGLSGNALDRFVASGQLLAGRNADIDRARANRADYAGRLARAIRAYEAAGGAGTYCEANGDPPPASTTPDVAVNEFSVIATLCGRMRAQSRDIGQAGNGLEPDAVALLGLPVPAGQTLPPSEIGSALEESAGLARLLQQQTALAAAAKAHLKTLEEYYQCEVRREAEPGAADRIRAVAGQVRDFIKLVSDMDDEALARQLAGPDEDEAAADEPASPTCRDEHGASHDRPAKVDSAADLAETAHIGRAEIAAALAATRSLEPGRSLLAAIQEEAQDFRASKLSDLLDVVAGDVAGDAPDAGSRGQRAAVSGVSLIEHVEQLERARAGTLPDTAGVLVRLAGARMRSASARIEADRLQQLKRLADLRVAALRREVLDLAAARRLAASPANFQRALIRYSDSWAQGRMPQQIIAHDMRGVRYLAWLDRERVAVEAGYGVLEPAVAQLQAYGAGGFHAEVIAQILSSIGLGAAAIGE